MYANQWRGACYPPKLGAGTPKDHRWPVFVFKPAVWNPPIMICPNDIEPAEEHSYIINDHIAEKGVKFGSKDLGGLTPSDVVLMGEKTSSVDDYYMNAVREKSGQEITDYGLGKVELYRHGIRLGSNYLYLDMHVATFRRPEQLARSADPWDFDSDKPVASAQ
jgi:hypothetical protein